MAQGGPGVVAGGAAAALPTSLNALPGFSQSVGFAGSRRRRRNRRLSLALLAARVSEWPHAQRPPAGPRSPESRRVCLAAAIPSALAPERPGAAEDAEDAAGDRWEVFEKIFSESGRTRTPDCCC
jgi:hypothetical protein